MQGHSGPTAGCLLPTNWNSPYLLSIHKSSRFWLSKVSLVFILSRIKTSDLSSYSYLHFPSPTPAPSSPKHLSHFSSLLWNFSTFSFFSNPLFISCRMMTERVPRIPHLVAPWLRAGVSQHFLSRA